MNPKRGRPHAELDAEGEAIARELDDGAARFVRIAESSDNPLLALDNVLATPHIAGSASDQVSGLIENLKLFVAGLRPRRLANPQILDLRTARASHLQAT